MGALRRPALAVRALAFRASSQAFGGGPILHAGRARRLDPNFALAGVGVSFAVDQGVSYGERLIQENVQSAIATAAGPIEEVGKAVPWHITEWLPWSGRSGAVEVAREYGSGIPCKDIVFTVADDKAHRLYASTICRNDQGQWMWALAEPSVHRWDYLQ